MGMASGGIGSLVGTPAEVALVRMTADGKLPVEQRRGCEPRGHSREFRMPGSLVGAGTS